MLSFFFFLFLIEFIGVTQVNKRIYVSGIWFYNTSPVYCTGFITLSEVSFHHRLPPHPPSLSYLPPPSFSSGHHRTAVCFQESWFCSVLNPFTSSTQAPAAFSSSLYYKLLLRRLKKNPTFYKIIEDKIISSICKSFFRFLVCQIIEYSENPLEWRLSQVSSNTDFM